MRRPYRSDSGPAGPRINDRIRISPVRLIDAEGEMVGVVDLDDAKRRAYDAGLDLVEVAADVRPPVVRIMDYGRFKYEKSKQDRANKSKSVEMKEVRLGRSMKIDPHDVMIRLRQARGFLLEGHRVQIVQNFRGREIAHRDRGDDRMDHVIETLSEVAKVEVSPRLNGRRMTMILIPDRTKCEAIKRREAAAKPPEAKGDQSADGKPTGKLEQTAEQIADQKADRKAAQTLARALAQPHGQPTPAAPAPPAAQPVAQPVAQPQAPRVDATAAPSAGPGPVAGAGGAGTPKSAS
jgi:translation initiation factor IF-3